MLISKEVQRFLIEKIDSIAELEVLMFLRTHRDRSWRCDLVADQIYSSEEFTAGVLKKLTKRGILTTDKKSPKSFQYRPHNQETARMVDQVAEVYTKYLIPVTNLVHKKSRRSIEDLAQAFKLKKES